MDKKSQFQRSLIGELKGCFRNTVIIGKKMCSACCIAEPHCEDKRSLSFVFVIRMLFFVPPTSDIYILFAGGIHPWEIQAR